jgi:NitT/TauT family transport system substrate-binding protein
VAGPEQLVKARARGLPVRAIASYYRRNPVVFYVLDDSDITNPRDFVGKTIHTHPNIIHTLHAVMSFLRITPDQYTMVMPDEAWSTSSETYAARFFNGEIDVYMGYLNGNIMSEYAARKKGYRLRIMFPDNYGAHFYGDTIFATDDYVASHPDLVERFLRATLKGWIYALERPSEVGEIVTRLNPELDAETETAKLRLAVPLLSTGEGRIGWMKPEDWADMVRRYRELGIVKKPLDPTQIYSMRFLEEVYGTN